MEDSFLWFGSLKQFLRKSLIFQISSNVQNSFLTYCLIFHVLKERFRRSLKNMKMDIDVFGYMFGSMNQYIVPTLNCTPSHSLLHLLPSIIHYCCFYLFKTRNYYSFSTKTCVRKLIAHESINTVNLYYMRY